jgi:hypothetical protein
MTELIKILVGQCKAEDESYLCNYERNFTSSNAKILPANAGPGKLNEIGTRLLLL